MSNVPNRVLQLLLTAAALTIVMAACSDQPTGPSSANLRPQHDFVLASSYIIDTGPGASGSSTIGQPALQNLSSGTFFQFLGGKFTLASPATIESVEGWMLTSAGTINVHIRADSSGRPGGTDFYSQSYSVAANTSYAWKVFSPVSVTLQPGTYWLTFEPSPEFSGAMSNGASSPLSGYAYKANPEARWTPMSASLGMRIFGSLNDASSQIASLRSYVAGAGLPKPLPTKIDGSLQKASDALTANNTAAACTNLQDVIDLINKQSVRKVPASVASEIISQTTAIRTEIGC